jgi:hypothetical protein
MVWIFKVIWLSMPLCIYTPSKNLHTKEKITLISIWFRRVLTWVHKDSLTSRYPRNIKYLTNTTKLIPMGWFYDTNFDDNYWYSPIYRSKVGPYICQTVGVKVYGWINKFQLTDLFSHSQHLSLGEKITKLPWEQFPSPRSVWWVCHHNSEPLMMNLSPPFSNTSHQRKRITSSLHSHLRSKI